MPKLRNPQDRELFWKISEEYARRTVEETLDRRAEERFAERPKKKQKEQVENAVVQTVKTPADKPLG